jgi:hypothetical protein
LITADLAAETVVAAAAVAVVTMAAKAAETVKLLNLEVAIMQTLQSYLQ